jgi:hypothetical protein
MDLKKKKEYYDQEIFFMSHDIWQISHKKIWLIPID